MTLADQQRTPRREPISGNVVIHTTESRPGPAAAEAVWRFIANRSDPGSYHVIVDAAVAVQMIPDSSEAFQVAVGGHNRHAFGIAAACRTTDWGDADTAARIDLIAAECVAFWRRQGIDPAGARWADPSEARTRAPLLFCHGDLQPGDRTDAWARHPRRAELDRALLDAIHRHTYPEGLTVADIQRILEAIEDDKRTTIDHVEEVRRALTDVKAHTEHVARVTAAEIVRQLSTGGTDGEPVDPDAVADRVVQAIADGFAKAAEG